MVLSGRPWLTKLTCLSCTASAARSHSSCRGSPRRYTSPSCTAWCGCRHMPIYGIHVILLIGTAIMYNTLFKYDLRCSYAGQRGWLLNVKTRCTVSAAKSPRSLRLTDVCPGGTSPDTCRLVQASQQIRNWVCLSACLSVCTRCKQLVLAGRHACQRHLSAHLLDICARLDVHGERLAGVVAVRQSYA